MHFTKYSSTGNDFIVFDTTQKEMKGISPAIWRKLCYRQQGIGADGVLLIKKESSDVDFSMVYINADGNEVAMCGNGARAAAHFATSQFGYESKKELRFKTKNGVYSASVAGDDVHLRMTELYDESKIKISDLFFAKTSFYVNTGVPHCVYQVENVDEVNLSEAAPPVRYEKRFEEGVNFNVFEVLEKNKVKMRTYERGVEAETLSCGTGAVAVAISVHRNFGDTGEISIETPGGLLKVSLNNDLSEIYLIGDVTKVFSGEIDLSILSKK